MHKSSVTILQESLSTQNGIMADDGTTITTRKDLKLEINPPHDLHLIKTPLIWDRLQDHNMEFECNRHQQQQNRHHYHHTKKVHQQQQRQQRQQDRDEINKNYNFLEEELEKSKNEDYGKLIEDGFVREQLLQFIGESLIISTIEEENEEENGEECSTNFTSHNNICRPCIYNAKECDIDNVAELTTSNVENSNAISDRNKNNCKKESDTTFNISNKRLIKENEANGGYVGGEGNPSVRWLSSHSDPLIRNYSTWLLSLSAPFPSCSSSSLSSSCTEKYFDSDNCYHYDYHQSSCNFNDSDKNINIVDNCNNVVPCDVVSVTTSSTATKNRMTRNKRDDAVNKLSSSLDAELLKRDSSVTTLFHDLNYNNNNNNNNNNINIKNKNNNSNSNLQEYNSSSNKTRDASCRIPPSSSSHPRLISLPLINFPTLSPSLLPLSSLLSATSKTKNSWQLFLAIFYLILYVTSSKCLAARQEASYNCTFPKLWEGTWFQSGIQQSIHIKDSIFSYRGKCAATDGDKYLLVDDKGCHRCLVIYQKHKNILQYKESECEDDMYMDQSNPAAMPMRSVLSDHRGGAHPNLNGHSRLSSSDQYIMRSNDDINDCLVCRHGRENLQNLCGQIPGDANLYSLFRENAEPVKCPLKGPFTFTYNRGHGECKNPVSNIESCTEDSRLLLNFQACPDIQGTESTVEELTCLGTWKEGNSRYLVGLVSHHHAISNEERYRCFVYDKISHLIGSFPGTFTSSNVKDAEYKLAQSGDATCNGLENAEVGSRIMTLRKPPPAERCDFPAWFKGPRHWHALMGNAGYIFHPSDGSMHITKPNGYMETRALCEQINKQTATEMMAVVHHTTGCQSGFMCMMFYRRDTHVAEIQTGEPAPRLEDACAPDHFDMNKLPYITLLASSPESQICPIEGLYTLRGAIGPPYITSRHKRNHNNKGHNQHSHHHHDLGHKRHGTLSFRNSEEFNEPTWRSHTRGLSNRNRRATDGLSAELPLSSSASLSSSSSSSSAMSIILKTASRQSPNEPVGRITITQQSNETQRNRREVPGCIVNYKAQRQLWVGCSEPNVIEVRPQCNEDGDEVYLCHGSWTENGTVYVIARHAGTQHGVCISYRPLEGNAVKLIIGDACYRGLMKPPDHHLVANLTVYGKCGDPSSSNPISNNWILIWFSTTFTLTLVLFNICNVRGNRR